MLKFYFASIISVRSTPLSGKKSGSTNGSGSGIPNIAFFQFFLKFNNIFIIQTEQGLILWKKSHDQSGSRHLLILHRALEYVVAFLERLGQYRYGTRGLQTVLRIRDVYPGSQIRLFSIPDPNFLRPESRIPDPHQRI